MSRVVDVATEGVRVPLSRARVAEIASRVLRAERVPAAMLSISFVTTRSIAALNRRHLGRSGSTDVISFGFARPRAGDPVIGDVYIAPAVARRNALQHGVTVREELMRLIVHGVLHALGYDHPEGTARTRSPMWHRQEKLLRQLMLRHHRSGERKRQARAA